MEACSPIGIFFHFIEFYTEIVHPILENGNSAEAPQKIRRLSSAEIPPEDTFYFGLDGDDTGTRLEEMFLSARDEASFKKMSESVSRAINELSKYIHTNISKNSVIFAAGDDMLFKGRFDESLLYTLQQIYQSKTSGMTCSIGYGKTFKEVYIALKLAKLEPGKMLLWELSLYKR